MASRHRCAADDPDSLHPGVKPRSTLERDRECSELSLEGIKFAALIATGTVIVGGAIVASLEKTEHWTTWDGIWWAATTVTTVGYGDLEVKTDGGRIIAMCIMLVGIGFVALLTAFIADRFVQGQREVDAKEDLILGELREIRLRLENLEAGDSRLVGLGPKT